MLRVVASKDDGIKKRTYYSLYDLYSRYVVGWMVAERESAFRLRCPDDVSNGRSTLGHTGRDEVT